MWKLAVSPAQGSHFAWLVYAMFVVLLGSTVPTPLYDLYRTQWQVPAFVITVVFACYVAGVLTALILAGHLSDHIGRRPVSVAGVGFALLAAGLFATASGVTAVGLARFLSGIAVGLCTGALTAALRENQSRPGQGPLAASAITSAGLAFGPLLGGLAAQFAPMPLRTVFITPTAATLPGMTVDVAVTCLDVEGNKVLWHVVAHDDVDRIGEGEHERTVVPSAKFRERLDDKARVCTVPGLASVEAQVATAGIITTTSRGERSEGSSLPD